MAMAGSKLNFWALYNITYVYFETQNMLYKFMIE